MTEKDAASLPKEKGIGNTLKLYLGPHGVIMILLVLLVIVGIGIKDFSPQLSHWYWLAMVLVTGIACLVMELSRARQKGISATTIIKKEVLTWISVLVGVNLVYFLFHSGRLDSENTGLIILLILALATFLAELRLGWRLCILGLSIGGRADSGHLSGGVSLDCSNGGAGSSNRCIFFSKIQIRRRGGRPVKGTENENGKKAIYSNSNGTFYSILPAGLCHDEFEG